MKGFIEFLKSKVFMIFTILLIVGSVAGIIVEASHIGDGKIIAAIILEILGAAGLVYNLTAK